jgi:hypothetical protein
MENYGGNYTKLDIRWHTGIRMGAYPGYGGVRIYDDQDMGTRIWSINEGGAGVLCTRDITAYYSDPRLKDFHGTIPNAVDKVMALNGYYFTENETARALGYNNYDMQVGVSSDEVCAVLPEIVRQAPISIDNDDHDYKTIDYGKLTPLLIEAIKEQQAQISELQTKLGKINDK